MITIIIVSRLRRRRSSGETDDLIGLKRFCVIMAVEIALKKLSTQTEICFADSTVVKTLEINI